MCTCGVDDIADTSMFDFPVSLHMFSYLWTVYLSVFKQFLYNHEIISTIFCIREIWKLEKLWNIRTSENYMSKRKCFVSLF